MVTGGIEGVGDALTGGLVARQFEPGAGETHEEGHGGACLNCGTALTGPYCHQCGQSGHIHRSLAAFWHDLAHGVLHFEGKIWRTLPLLAWRPGELTRRYIEGERARFISPIALFLFSVFLMVSVFHWVGPPIHPHSQTIHNGKVLKGPELQAEVKQAEQHVAALEAERARLAAANADLKAIDAQLDDAREERDGLRTGLAFANGVDVSHMTIQTGRPAADRAFDRLKRNPELAAYEMQTNAYKFSWALIPISVPFVWLLFHHRRRYRAFKAYDHTVFVTYSLSFMTLLLVALSLLHLVFLPTNLAGLAFLLIPPVHMCRQLHGAYSLSWFSAVWRTFVLVFFACFAALGLFLLLLLLLGVMH